MVNDHFVLWPWRQNKLYFNSLHILLSFMAESIIKLAWIQFRHVHLGAVLVLWSWLFSELLCLISHSLTVSCFQKSCLLSWSRHLMIIQWKWEIDLRDWIWRQSAWWTMDGGSWHCTGDRDQHHPQEREMQKSKMAVSAPLTNSCEKKGNEKQRCQGKIHPFECRVPKNTKER